MKCYYHPDVNAVTHCGVCAKPLCANCRVVVGEKTYCKDDAERVLGRYEKSMSLRRRGVAISIASVLDELEGLAGVVVGFLLILIGLLAPSALNSSLMSTTVEPFLNYFAAVLTFSPTETVAIGFVLMVLGITEMIAGYYLWKRSKTAAVLSIGVSVVGLAFLGAFEVILALAGAFTFIHVASVVGKLGAIGYGWPHLKTVNPPAMPQARNLPSQPRRV